MIDLHQLPTLEDRLSYLYLEHGWIDQSDKAVAFHTKESETHIPAASLALLMLGPGTSITHAAVRFDGVLVVTDRAAFKTTVANGIGSGKAFGLGLLSLAPVS